MHAGGGRWVGSNKLVELKKKMDSLLVFFFGEGNINQRTRKQLFSPSRCINGTPRDSPGGPVAKTSNAGALGSIPGQGTRSSAPQ